MLKMRCYGSPFPHELGHWLAVILEAYFLSNRSWLRLKILCGFKPTCGCQSREAALNHLGHHTLTALATSYYAASGLLSR